MKYSSFSIKKKSINNLLRFHKQIFSKKKENFKKKQLEFSIMYFFQKEIIIKISIKKKVLSKLKKIYNFKNFSKFLYSNFIFDVTIFFRKNKQGNFTNIFKYLILLNFNIKRTFLEICFQFSIKSKQEMGFQIWY